MILIHQILIISLGIISLDTGYLTQVNALKNCEKVKSDKLKKTSTFIGSTTERRKQEAAK